MPSLPTSLYFLPTILSALATAQLPGPIQSASFTWYDDCKPSKLPACGPNAKMIPGTGFAATNRINYEAGGTVVNGIGKGCGTCWHVQPQSNPYPMNGNTFGKPVVVKINNECQDAGYCDQTLGGAGGEVVGNTLYQKQLHFDLCTESGVAEKFFGNINHFGVLLGVARQVDCAELTNGDFGMGMGMVDGAAVDSAETAAPSAAQPSSTSLSSSPPTPSAAAAAGPASDGGNDVAGAPPVAQSSPSSSPSPAPAVTQNAVPQNSPSVDTLAGQGVPVENKMAQPADTGKEQEGDEECEL
ncbi:MAG: hypothetical protein Q9163_005309 [Psora crenata]